jgi:ribose transport system permease protein
VTFSSDTSPAQSPDTDEPRAAEERETSAAHAGRPNTEGLLAGRREPSTGIRGPLQGVLRLVSGRFALPIALIATIVLFGALRPHQFLTSANVQTILTQAAPLAIVAASLTVVLLMNDFDLSFASVASLASAAAVALMSLDGQSWIVAIAAGIAVGLVVGIVNGVLVTIFGTASFVTTLAVGTALTGIEYLITNQNTLYSNISPTYISLGQSSALGLQAPVWIAIAVTVFAYVLLHQSEVGRRMQAIGGSSEAARLSGIRVTRLRLTGFIVVGLAAAISGMLGSAAVASYTPNADTGILLPAYAAVFLGSTTLTKTGSFNMPGTVLGILYLGVLQNGLIVLNLASAWVFIVQGAILVCAVLLARVGKRHA